jgi:hypothetical protein
MVVDVSTVKVLAVRHIREGLFIAHVQVGEQFGDVPAAPGVKAGEPARLINKLQVREGRLQSSLRVERPF